MADNETDGLKLLKSSSDFDEIINSDLRGWLSFFNHDKMPEFILYIQKLHYEQLRRLSNNPHISDEDIRKAIKQKGAGDILFILSNVLIESKEGLRKA